MNKEVFTQGSTYAGLALIFNGVAAALAKDYGTAITNIAAGIAAVLHK